MEKHWEINNSSLCDLQRITNSAGLPTYLRTVDAESVREVSIPGNAERLKPNHCTCAEPMERYKHLYRFNTFTMVKQIEGLVLQS